MVESPSSLIAIVVYFTRCVRSLNFIQMALSCASVKIQKPVCSKVDSSVSALIRKLRTAPLVVPLVAGPGNPVIKSTSGV
jgi:hypothetical protein